MDATVDESVNKNWRRLLTQGHKSFLGDYQSQDQSKANKLSSCCINEREREREAMSQNMRHI